MHPWQVDIVFKFTPVKQYIQNGLIGSGRAKAAVARVVADLLGYVSKMKVLAGCLHVSEMEIGCPIDETGVVESGGVESGGVCYRVDILEYLDTGDEEVLLNCFFRSIRSQKVNDLLAREFQCPAVRTVVRKIHGINHYVNHNGHRWNHMQQRYVASGDPTYTIGDQELLHKIRCFSGNTYAVQLCLLQMRRKFLQFCNTRHNNGRLHYYVWLVTTARARFDDVCYVYLGTLQRIGGTRASSAQQWHCGNCNISVSAGDSDVSAGVPMSMVQVKKHTLREHPGLPLRTCGL